MNTPGEPAGYSIRDGSLTLNNQEWKNWMVVNGPPHRHEFGQLVLRWANAGCPRETLLVSGPSSRPAGPFLKSCGIEWHCCETLADGSPRPACSYSPSLASPLPPLFEINIRRDDLLDVGMLTELDMETFLVSHPHRLAEVLGVDVDAGSLRRQVAIEQGRPDIVINDSTERTCVIECKRGVLHASHVGQLIEYYRPRDRSIAGARLVLMLNSASPAAIALLRTAGLELCVYPYGDMARAMTAEGFQPEGRTRPGTRAAGIHLDEATCDLDSWKGRFVAALKDLIPEELQKTLAVQTDYKHPKKVRLSRVVDDRTVLYVASNAGRLEFGLPIIHHLLMARSRLQIMRGKGPAVFLSKGGQVPNITLEIKADEAIDWIADHQDDFVEGLERYEAGLDAVISKQVRRHFGATIQDSNSLKLQATGECEAGAECPYCRLIGK